MMICHRDPDLSGEAISPSDFTSPPKRKLTLWRGARSEPGVVGDLPNGKTQTTQGSSDYDLPTRPIRAGRVREVRATVSRLLRSCSPLAR